MIGNDIIDLQLAVTQSDWTRKGFLRKIFSEEERYLISNAQNSFQTVWLLWSMKESAYKAYMHQCQHRFFAPKMFECQRLTKNEGLVVVGQDQFKTTSLIHNKYIYTEVNDADHNRPVDHHHFEIEPKVDQSRFLYREIQKTISRKLAIPIHNLSIRKNTIGIPKLYQNEILLDVHFSISHHGKYGAYSIKY